METAQDEHLAIYAKDVNIVQATKTIHYWFYYEVTKDEYEAGKAGSEADMYESYEDNGTVIYLKAYSLDENDEDYYGNVLSVDEDSAGFLSLGTMYNDRLIGVTIRSDWISGKMAEISETGKSPKIYVGCWSVLTYYRNASITKETSKAFTYLTFKNREFFDLD